MEYEYVGSIQGSSVCIYIHGHDVYRSTTAAFFPSRVGASPCAGRGCSRGDADWWTNAMKCYDYYYYYHYHCYYHQLLS